MTITYDAQGLCTRCGSTGHTAERVYDVTQLLSEAKP